MPGLDMASVFCTIVRTWMDCNRTKVALVSLRLPGESCIRQGMTCGSQLGTENQRMMGPNTTYVCIAS
jgi:hypothetical protein